MRVSVKDGIYKGSHIPGPSHNYLGVTFSPGSGPLFIIEVLPPAVGCDHHNGLTADEVRPWIEEGFHNAGNEINRVLEIGRVEIIEDDSRRPEVYRELARRIALKYHEDQSSI